MEYSHSCTKLKLQRSENEDCRRCVHKDKRIEQQLEEDETHSILISCLKHLTCSFLDGVVIEFDFESPYEEEEV